MPARVGIIIVDYHGEENTRECLDSLAGMITMHDWRSYVVQPEAITNQIKNHSLKPSVIARTDNRGFAWANNLGITQAFADGCDRVILLNNDTTVDANFLDPLLKQLESHQVGLVSPKIYFYPGREYHHDEYTPQEQGHVIWYAGGVIDWQNIYAYHWGVDEVDHGQYTEAVETDFATGCCVAVTRKTIDTIGLMDESYFLYLEDVDWSVRAKQKGYRVVFEPHATIFHKNAGSTGGPGSVTHQYYQTRNRIKFALHHAPLKTKMAVIRESIWMSLKDNGVHKRAVLDAWSNQFGKRNRDETS